MITLGEIIVNVEANRKAFDDAMMRLHAILNEPHTCPTCDGYGYMRQLRRGPEGEMEPLTVGCFIGSFYGPEQFIDIPCPKCNA